MRFWIACKLASTVAALHCGGLRYIVPLLFLGFFIQPGEGCYQQCCRLIVNESKKGSPCGEPFKVPRVGVEPTLPKEPDFESSASANSAIWAKVMLQVYAPVLRQCKCNSVGLQGCYYMILLIKWRGKSTLLTCCRGKDHEYSVC